MIPTEIPETLENFINVTFGERQPEYLPLPALVQDHRKVDLDTEYTGSVITRWRLSPEELLKLIAGDDVYLEVLTFGNICSRCGKSQGLQPVKVGVWSDRVGCVDG